MKVKVKSRKTRGVLGAIHASTTKWSLFKTGCKMYLEIMMYEIKKLFKK